MANIYDMVDTWNNGATVFTAIKMNVTDTASAAASLLMDLQVGGSSKFKVDKTGLLTLPANLAGKLAFGATGTGISHTSGTDAMLFSSAGTNVASPEVGQFKLMTPLSFSAVWTVDSDLYLYRDAANILAQRNGVNAQAFRVYNTYTDASNYEAGSIGWAGNVFSLSAINGGTGTFRGMDLRASTIYFYPGGSLNWLMSGSGHFLAQTDNTIDIGASGANRPRNLYVGTSLYAGGSGVFTGFVEGSRLRVTDGVAAPAAVAGYAQLYVDTADGDLKVIFGDGTIKTIATDT